jgi:signal transduction histidine kinase
VSLPAITRSGPLRWCAEAALGLYRSTVLAGLIAAIPVLGAAVAFFGTEFALSWSAQLSAPVAVRVLATAGEVAMGALWTCVAVWLALKRASRPLSQAARSLAKDWLGLRIEVRYQPPPPVVRMATGYWWNGYDYHQSERDARWHARLQHGFRDPQFPHDARWIGVAAVTVLPSAALPPLALAFGISLTLLPGLAAWGTVLIVASLVLAPFTWRVFGPVAAACLGQAPRSRIEELTAIRADMTQTQVAELERIERGLHDGPQARIVALGMSMGAAEQLLDTDPDAAKAILAKARASSAAALAELRALARGINPPVLAERGLVDAVRALALDAPVSVSVRSDLPARPERPVETAVYFAICELLANVVKHARATRASIDLGYDGRTLTVIMTDDGQGGADAARGSGLNGIERRIAPFDGRLEIESPDGGPTLVTFAVPCALS